MVSTKMRKGIQIVVIALQVLLLLLICSLLAVLVIAYHTDSWCYDRGYLEPVIMECLLCLVPPLLTVVVLILYLAKPAVADRKGMGLIPVLLQCAAIGCILYGWEALREPWVWCIFYFVSGGVAVFCCGLLLYSLGMHPWFYLCFGGICLVCGGLGAAMGDYFYFDPRFFLWFPEAGAVLLASGMILRKRKKAQAKVPAVEEQTVAPVPEPTVMPVPEPVVVPEIFVQKENTCPHCGAKLEVGDIYCLECGNRVS